MGRTTRFREITKMLRTQLLNFCVGDTVIIQFWHLQGVSWRMWFLNPGWSLVNRGERDPSVDSKLKGPHLGGIAVFTLDPAFTVELEAVGALVQSVEFRWRGITCHRNTSSLLPAAILGTLGLEGPSFRKRRKVETSQGPNGCSHTLLRHPRSLEPAGLSCAFLIPESLLILLGDGVSEEGLR